MIINVIEKYAKNIAQETLQIKLVYEVDAPVTVKEADVGGYTVLIQIGL